MLVSEIMLQQTQVARIVPRWRSFLGRFPDPASCAAAPVGEVIALWVGLGYNQRAVRLHQAAAAMVARHGASVPCSLRELQALPGIGPYTARAVMAFAFEAEVAVVDTNVARVLARAVAARPLGRAVVQEMADSLVPRGSAGDARGVGLGGGGLGGGGVAGGGLVGGGVSGGGPGGGGVAGPLSWRWNQAMLDLGAQHCTAGRPSCDGCPLAAVGQCAWARAGYPLPDPATGSAGVSTPQSAFAGSDRQGRGRLVRALLDGPLRADGLESAAGWAGQPERTARAVASLVADGLAVQVGDTLTLP